MKYSKVILSSMLTGALALNVFQYNYYAKQLEKHRAAAQEYVEEIEEYNSLCMYTVTKLDQAEKTIVDMQHIVSSYQTDWRVRAASPQYYLNVPLDEDLQDYIYALCNKYGIVDNYTLVYALIEHESAFDSTAISKTDDYGLMQINICNHEYLREELGIVDFLDPYDNVHGGIYLLSTLLHKYDASAALMAYNMGEDRANKLWRRGVYTSTYAMRILDLEEKYKK